MFINDAPSRFRRALEYALLFADDIIYLLRIGKRLADMYIARTRIDQFNSEMHQWLNKWRLRMSIKKCSYVLFNKKSAKKKLPFQVKLANEEIEQSSCSVFLGMSFDPMLTFNNNTNQILSKCNKRLSIIKILSAKRWQASKRIQLQIYISLVRSVIEYSAMTLSCLSKQNKIKLERIQRSAIKIIFNLEPDTPTVEVDKLHSLPSIAKRMDDLNEKYFAKAMENKNPLVKEMLEASRLSVGHAYRKPFLLKDTHVTNSDRNAATPKTTSNNARNKRRGNNKESARAVSNKYRRRPWAAITSAIQAVREQRAATHR